MTIIFKVILTDTHTLAPVAVVAPVDLPNALTFLLSFTIQCNFPDDRIFFLKSLIESLIASRFFTVAHKFIVAWKNQTTYKNNTNVFVTFLKTCFAVYKNPLFFRTYKKVEYFLLPMLDSKNCQFCRNDTIDTINENLKRK